MKRFSYLLFFFLSVQRSGLFGDGDFPLETLVYDSESPPPPIRRAFRKTDLVSPFPKGVLQDRTILITRATEGIGKALAKRCIEEGAKVMLQGENEPLLRLLQRELGPRTDSLRFNPYDGDNSRGWLQQIIDRFGSLDCVVVNGKEGLTFSIQDAFERWQKQGKVGNLVEIETNDCRPNPMTPIPGAEGIRINRIRIPDGQLQHIEKIAVEHVLFWLSDRSFPVTGVSYEISLPRETENLLFKISPLSQ